MNQMKAITSAMLALFAYCLVPLFGFGGVTISSKKCRAPNSSFFKCQGHNSESHWRWSWSWYCKFHQHFDSMKLQWDDLRGRTDLGSTSPAELQQFRSSLKLKWGFTLRLCGCRTVGCPTACVVGWDDVVSCHWVCTETRKLQKLQLCRTRATEMIREQRTSHTARAFQQVSSDRCRWAHVELQHKPRESCKNHCISVLETW